MQILMLERRTSPAMVSAVLLGLGVAFAGPAAFAGDATTPEGPSPATPSTARLQRLRLTQAAGSPYR